MSSLTNVTNEILPERISPKIVKPEKLQKNFKLINPEILSNQSTEQYMEDGFLYINENTFHKWNFADKEGYYRINIEDLECGNFEKNQHFGEPIKINLDGINVVKNIPNNRQTVERNVYDYVYDLFMFSTSSLIKEELQFAEKNVYNNDYSITINETNNIQEEEDNNEEQDEDTDVDTDYETDEESNFSDCEKKDEQKDERRTSCVVM